MAFFTRVGKITGLRVDKAFVMEPLGHNIYGNWISLAFSGLLLIILSEFQNVDAAPAADGQMLQAFQSQGRGGFKQVAKNEV